MAIKFTAEQKNAIDATGTVLVAAAAGSGKTAVLTERVIQRVCFGEAPLNIDRMLIVTFTNASALEMRVRIGKELDRVCSENPNNAHILKQKLLLKNAKICTIDSFCIDLVRKNFGLLGISPDFMVASGAQTAVLKERAIKDVLSGHFANPDKSFNMLCETFNIYNGERGLSKAVTDVYDFSLCLSRPEHWMSSSVDNYFAESLDCCVFCEPIFDRAVIKLSSAIENTEFILRECLGTEFESAWFNGFSDTFELLKSMKQSALNRSWNELYDFADNFEKTAVKTVRGAKNTELRDVMKGIRDGIFNDVKSIAKEMCGDEASALAALHNTGGQVAALIGLVKEFSERFTELLIKNNLLTFSLVEQFALKLLCTETDDGLVPSELSKDICKLYDEVLVDEYQDNNDLQDSLFFAVSDSGKHLFMVGDVKQCIYAFRNANPDNFLRHKNAYPLFDEKNNTEMPTKKVILSANFRSRKGVCDFVNGLCGALMQSSTCSLEYNSEEELVAGANYPENNIPAAEIILTENTASNQSRDMADAASVADYVSSCLEEEPFLRVDRESQELRKAEYKDFAILLRSPSKRAKFYIDALKKKGIPVVYNSGEFFESPEILTAMSILRTVNNPTEDIPLLASMTSVAFGFTYDDVAEIRAENKYSSLYKCLVSSADTGNEKSQRMLDVLSKLRCSAVTVPISKLISEMYNITYLKEIMGCGENGRQIRNNLSALVSMAADYEQFSDMGLSGFIEYFDRSASEGSAGDKLPQKDVNAVRIMSFHGSKGLQFPVCIVAGCGNGFNKMDLIEPMIINGKYGIGMNYVENGIKYQTPARNALRIAELNKLIAEELRLFYVAMTRAEERLVLSITSKALNADIVNAAASLGVNAGVSGKVPADYVTSADGLKRFILSAALLQKSGDKLCELADINTIGFNGKGEFKLILSDSHKSDVVSHSIADGETAGHGLSKENRQLIEERFSYIYPYSNACITPSKLAVTELVHGDREQYAFKARPRFMSKAGLTPAERGTALHKFMQYADFEAVEHDLEAEITRLYEYEFISEQEADAIDRQMLTMFFKSQIYNRIKSSDNVQREYKFMVHYPYNGQTTIIQGIADCIFEEDGKIVIVDFKTDNVNDMDTLANRYSQQLSIYKEAVAEIFEREVSECVIYSVKLGQEINV